MLTQQAYAYDARNRAMQNTQTISQEARPDGDLALTTTFAYGDKVNLTQITNADGSTVQYNYDEWNRPTSVYKDAGTGYVGTGTAQGIQFDAMGNLQQLAYRDLLNTTATLTYDVRNRLDTFSVRAGAI